MCFKSDVPCPSDIVNEVDIHYFGIEQSVSIGLRRLNIPFTKPPKVWLTTVQDTNSMNPVMDYKHTCVLIAGADLYNQSLLLDALQPGNVVVAVSDTFNIIHRIKKITRDKKGRKYTLKGDNNFMSDPYDIRDESIRWLLIGIIY